MLTLVNSTILFHSPLDQFGADSIGGDLFSLVKCSFIDKLDIVGLDELFDTSF
jgi:hypothetical protein